MSVISYTDVCFINVAAEVIFFFLTYCCIVQQEENEVCCGQECYLYKMS